MNFHIGDGTQGWSGTRIPAIAYTNLADLIRPANPFVLVDEHELSIDDAAFAVTTDTPFFLTDIPATRHNSAGVFSFADGHGEIHRWMDPRTIQVTNLSVTLVGDQDVIWLQRHSVNVPPF